MGVVKRTLSPGFDHCDDQGSEDIVLASCMVGQTDIRNFCTHFGAGYPSKVLRRTTSSPPRAEEDAVPLVKLPGQRDIRHFFRSDVDEEAAREMGLSFCLHNDIDEGSDINVIADEIAEANRADEYWNMAMAAAEDAAVAMGLSFGMREDIEEFLEGVAEDIFGTSWQEELKSPTEDMYEADVEAARAMGLSLSIEDEVCIGHIDKKPRLEERRCPAVATTPKRRALKEEKLTPTHDSKRIRIAKEMSDISDAKAMDGWHSRPPSTEKGLTHDSKRLRVAKEMTDISGSKSIDGWHSPVPSTENGPPTDDSKKLRVAKEMFDISDGKAMDDWRSRLPSTLEDSW